VGLFRVGVVEETGTPPAGEATPDIRGVPGCRRRHRGPGRGGPRGRCAAAGL